MIEQLSTGDNHLRNSFIQTDQLDRDGLVTRLLEAREDLRSRELELKDLKQKYFELHKAYLEERNLNSKVTEYSLHSIRTTKRLSLLNRINDRIRSSLDLETVLHTIVNELGNALDVNCCILVEFVEVGEDQKRAVFRYQYNSEETRKILGDCNPEESPLLRSIFTSSEPVVINDTLEVITPDVTVQSQDYHTPRSLMGMPVVAGGKQIAFLGVANYQNAHDWSQDEIELLLDVTGQAGSAITNARLYSEVTEERSRKELLLQSMAEGVVAIDSEGHLTTLNPAAEIMLGISRYSVLGCYAADILPFPLSESPSNYRVQYDGRTIAVTTSDIQDQKGGKVIMMRDVTLEARIESLKDDFITLVSHEFRTPVTAITGALDILSDEETGPLNELQRDFLKVAWSNTEKMRQIMNDVIDISTIQGGNLTLDIGPVMLADVINRAVEGGLSELCEQKNLKVTVDLKEAPRVYGDARRIVQILSNLISNAYKYTPAGGEVTILARPENDRMVRVSIADTGIGLTLHESARIGESFYRVDNSLIRDIGGTGLGLAIAKALTELHGGRLEVCSTPGSGSNFSILLPNVKASEAL